MWKAFYRDKNVCIRFLCWNPQNIADINFKNQREFLKEIYTMFMDIKIQSYKMVNFHRTDL